MAIEVAIIPGLRFASLSLTPQLSSTIVPKSRFSFPRRSRSSSLFHSGVPSASASTSGSLVKDENVRFTEEETQLIDALIGIQGRGRSASPQQVKVYLRTEDPRVSNIVQFWEAIGELKVEAAASIKDGTRILFRFDKAAFSFKFLPFKVPYPVPFRLLGDEAKGWLDTTYLSNSGNIRISRGNKGTTFVLQKKTEPRQKLLSAISTGTAVTEAIDEFLKLNQLTVERESELQLGEWQLIWSSQMETDSWIENAANGLMGNQIVREDGRLKILVDILLGFKFSMDGTFVKSGSKTYDITMDDAAILAGPFGLPMEMKSQFNLEILYTDEKIRITRGYNQILFVHLRVK